jgi:hypothetical protein
MGNGVFSIGKISNTSPLLVNIPFNFVSYFSSSDGYMELVYSQNGFSGNSLRIYTEDYPSIKTIEQSNAISSVIINLTGRYRVLK